jgi:hypothetical protein
MWIWGKETAGISVEDAAATSEAASIQASCGVAKQN